MRRVPTHRTPTFPSSQSSTTTKTLPSFRASCPSSGLEVNGASIFSTVCAGDLARSRSTEGGGGRREREWDGWLGDECPKSRHPVNVTTPEFSATPSRCHCGLQDVDTALVYNILITLFRLCTGSVSSSVSPLHLVTNDGEHCRRGQRATLVPSLANTSREELVQIGGATEAGRSR